VIPWSRSFSILNNSRPEEMSHHDCDVVLGRVCMSSPCHDYVTAQHDSFFTRNLGPKRSALERHPLKTGWNASRACVCSEAELQALSEDR
jgi:hypothetical protein